MDNKEFSGEVIYPYSEDETFYEYVRVALDSSPRESRLLFGAAGAARVAYNWVIGKFREVQEMKREAHRNGEDPKQIPLKVNGNPDMPYLANEYGMRKLWNKEKSEVAPWWKMYSKECYASGIRRACAAIDNFIKSLKTTSPRKNPGFHRKSDLSQSFEITTGTFGIDEDNPKNIVIPRIGKVHTFENVKKLVDGRPIKRMTVLFDGLRWFASILVVGDRTNRSRYPKRNRNFVGIDVGCKELAVCSDGTVYEHKRFDKESNPGYRHYQRAVARKVKGSKSRDKAKKNALKKARRATNKREEYLQKITTEICLNNEVICIEDLNVRGMESKGGSRKKGLNRSINNASLSKFRTLLEQKSKRMGNTVVVIDRYYPSTQICSNCKGYPKTKVTLADRTYHCDYCGLEIDRDFNASLNILDEGLRILDSNERKVLAGLPVEDHTNLPKGKDSMKLEPSIEPASGSCETWSYTGQPVYFNNYL